LISTAIDSSIESVWAVLALKRGGDAA